jgi:hypothetical protein
VTRFEKSSGRQTLLLSDIKIDVIGFYTVLVELFYTVPRGGIKIGEKEERKRKKRKEKKRKRSVACINRVYNLALS